MARRTASKNGTNYTDLRIGLLRAGYTFRSFALSNGYPPQTVYAAASGRRAGIKSVKIMKHLREVAHAE